MAMVYIREIAPHTFLHFSTAGEAFRLRDFSGLNYPLGHEILRQSPGCNSTSIRQKAGQPGNHGPLAVPGAPAIKNTGWWNDYTTQLNTQYNIMVGPLPPLPPPPPGERLLDRFRNDVDDPIRNASAIALKEVIDRYVNGLAMIEDKNGIFNHWCNDEAGHLGGHAAGMGWTANVLERCRQNGQLQYIQTSNPITDFALLSMNLNLKISAARNVLVQDQEDTIMPDGLAVRRDGSVAVLEVKGPQDESDISRCIIQSFCGALAVYAKREMITRIARAPANRRPAAANFQIPAEEPSMAVYALISHNKYAIGKIGPLRSLCGLLCAAFRPVRDIILFSVNPNDAGFPTTTTYDLGIRCDGPNVTLF